MQGVIFTNPDYFTVVVWLCHLRLCFSISPAVWLGQWAAFPPAAFTACTAVFISSLQRGHSSKCHWSAYQAHTFLLEMLQMAQVEEIVMAIEKNKDYRFWLSLLELFLTFYICNAWWAKQVSNFVHLTKKMRNFFKAFRGSGNLLKN